MVSTARRHGDINQTRPLLLRLKTMAFVQRSFFEQKSSPTGSARREAALCEGAVCGRKAFVALIAFYRGSGRLSKMLFMTRVEVNRRTLGSADRCRS